MTVEIVRGITFGSNGKAAVAAVTPYHPAFPQAAKALGGKWGTTPNGTKAWLFDARDEEAVRDLCRRVYGTDGAEAPDTCDVTITVTTPGVLLALLTEQSDAQWWFAGRGLASRRGRDYAVRLGEGVRIVSGRFTPTGGSMKYPAISYEGEAITLLVRDVPRLLAEQECAKLGDEASAVQITPG